MIYIKKINCFKIKILITAVAVLGVATLFTSCKKDYVCECIMDAGGTSSSVSYDIKSASKKDAKDACASHESGVPSILGASITCELK